MGAFFGAVFSLLLFAVVFVVGVIACATLIVKGIRKLFNKD